MKLATFGNENAATAGAAREIAIGFQANAVAFYAQISGLAEDKVGYPMRELNTNAWDATRARYGADVPEDRRPELTLPSTLNPVFRVRDYGFGMNQDLMETVYGQMYASTKRESSDEVGGWGIGRFSSFGYLIGREGAASYRVTSIAVEADGRRLKTIWTVSINRNGTPVLRELMSMATDEETGLEVSFDVRREDIPTFHQRARSILWSFDPRPRVTPDFAWPEMEVLASGDGWTYFNSASAPFGRGPGLPFHGPQVRMGCVTYPIDLHQIEAHGLLDSSEPVLFDAGIGTLSVTLSREGLAYDERTVATLKSLIEGFASKVADIVQERVNEATTYFEAVSIFERESRSIGSRTGRLRPRIFWAGHPMRESVLNPDVCKFMQLAEGWRTFEKFSGETAHLSYLNGAQVVVEHRPFYSMERLDAAGLVGKHILWVRVKKDRLDAALNMLGNPEYTVLDDTKVEATPRGEKVRKMVRSRRTLEVTRHGLHRRTQEIDLSAGGVYVREIKGVMQFYRRRREAPTYQVFADGTSIEWTNLDAAVRNIRDLELVEAGTPILIATENEELGDNWVHLGKKVERSLKRKVNTRHLSGLNNKTTYNMDRTLRTMAEHVEFDDAPADIRRFDEDLTVIWRQLSNREDNVQPTDRAIAALRHLGRPLELPEFECPIEAIGKRWKSLKEKYPLLSHVVPHNEYGVSDEKRKEMAHYFQLLALLPQTAEEPAPATDTDELQDDEVLAEAA